MLRRPFILIFVCLCLSSCATVYNPATQRNEFIFINTQNEISIGEAIDRSVRQDYRISSATLLNQRVKKIGSAIVQVCDRRDLEYIFFVVEDKELNAFSIPGGFVYVNTGLLDRADDNELAGVMAHEIGHLVARHSVKHLQAALGFDIVMSIAFNQSDAVDLYRAVNVVYNLVSLGYSREDERQADKLAVIYAFKAGYDPRGMLTFFEKIKEEEKKNGTQNIPVFLRSHPDVEERIRNIKREIAAVEHYDNRIKEINILDDTGAKNIPSGDTDYSGVALNEKVATPHKVCPVCKKVFPSSYNFCPQDGSMLEG